MTPKLLIFEDVTLSIYRLPSKYFTIIRIVRVPPRLTGSLDIRELRVRRPFSRCRVDLSFLDISHVVRGENEPVVHVLTFCRMVNRPNTDARI